MPSPPQPEKITIDGHQAYPWAIKDLKKLKKKVLHRTSKYLNNRIESDHARLKQKFRPIHGFKTFASAKKTIAGMEALLMPTKTTVYGYERLRIGGEIRLGTLSNGY